MVEEHGTNIVKMAIEGEQAAPGLVRPNLDLVIITTGDEERLRLVEVDTSNWSIVLFESINQSSHSIIPKLNGRGVKRYENPWSGRRTCQLDDNIEDGVGGASHLLG